MWVSPTYAVPALMVVHGVLAGYGLGRESLWLDEVMSIEMATGSWDAIRGWFVMLPEQHPFYYLLLRPWLFVFGTSDIALRSLSLTMGVASVGAIYLLASRIRGAVVGMAAASLLAISPFWIYYSQEGRMYTLLVLLSIVASVLWLDHYSEEGERKRPRSLVPYWVVGVLGIYTHVFFAFVVMAHALALLLGDGRLTEKGRQALKLGLPVLVAYLPWLILILTHMPDGQGWKDWRHVVFGIPYTFVRFAIGYGELLANYRWLERIGELLRAEAGILALAALTHAGLFLRGLRDLAGVPQLGKALLGAGLLLPLLLPLLLSPVILLSGERYFMVVLPLYLVVLGAGAVGFVEDQRQARGVRPVALLTLLGLAVLSGRTVYAHHFEADFGKEQWAEVIEAMADSPPGTPVVVTPIQSTNTLEYHLSDADGLEILPWDGGALRPAPGGQMWLLVARLEDPAPLIASLPAGWAVEEKHLYPKETGLWLMRAVRTKR
jgi:4-amino-4-deoxy-L-arabinose transferase-like glycosyltransferase